MHIRYLMLDNGLEFQDEVVTGDTWGAVKPKTVCIYYKTIRLGLLSLITYFILLWCMLICSAFQLISIEESWERGGWFG